MRRDETSVEAVEPIGEHLDEGTAHAWLDGALPADEGARIEAHVAACPDCAAVVAEARGLIAGASRIVGALDIVPGGVIPAAPAAPATPAVPIPPDVRPIGSARSARSAQPSRRWMLRAAAGVVVMVGGTALVVRSTARNPANPMAESVAAVQAVSAGAGAAADLGTPLPAAAPATSMTPAPAAPMAAPMPTPPTEADAPRADRSTAQAAQPLAETAKRMAVRAEPQARPQAAGASAPPAMPVPPVAARVAEASASVRDTAVRAGGAAPSVTSGFTATQLGQVTVAPPVAAAPLPAGAARAMRRVDAGGQARDAADRSTTVAGCFTLDAGGAAGWPERLTLDATALPPSTRRAYGARVRSPAADSAYWTFLTGDSVRVVWFVRSGGVEARLAPGGDGVLRGIARPLTSAGASEAGRALVARRVDCQDR